MEYHCELMKNVFCVSFISDCTNTAAIRLTTSYILNTFLFYRLFDNVLMKTYSLFGRRVRGDKKAFQETKICGV